MASLRNGDVAPVPFRKIRNSLGAIAIGTCKEIPGANEGLDGWGECATGSDYGEAAFSAKTIIDKSFVKKLSGKNPLEYRKLWYELYASTENYGRRDLGILVLSGVDTA